MKPEDVKTVADAKKIVNERKLTHVKVGVFDIDGILRGKYLHRDKFFGAYMQKAKQGLKITTREDTLARVVGGS